MNRQISPNWEGAGNEKIFYFLVVGYLLCLTTCLSTSTYTYNLPKTSRRCKMDRQRRQAQARAQQRHTIGHCEEGRGEHQQAVAATGAHATAARACALIWRVGQLELGISCPPLAGPGLLRMQESNRGSTEAAIHLLHT
eukprot:scaffold869_cov105-Isochrysis_galbana.AAC.29